MSVSTLWRWRENSAETCSSYVEYCKHILYNNAFGGVTRAVQLITLFTRVRHLSVYSAQIKPVHPLPFYLLLRSILISASHERLGLSSSLFPPRFSTKTPANISNLPHTCHIYKMFAIDSCWSFNLNGRTEQVAEPEHLRSKLCVNCPSIAYPTYSVPNSTSFTSLIYICNNACS